MINQTIIDILWFLLIFIIVICAFGNAIMIIDRYQRNYSDLHNFDYEPVMGSVFDWDVTDSWINQYLVGLGEFSYDSYAENPSKTYLWVYFILATCLFQILFFNMLITVMGSTYGNVIEQKDRQTLISKTQVLSRYVHVCKLDHTKLQDHRYIYIAFRINDDDEDGSHQSTESSPNIDLKVL